MKYTYIYVMIAKLLIPSEKPKILIEKFWKTPEIVIFELRFY